MRRTTNRVCSLEGLVVGLDQGDEPLVVGRRGGLRLLWCPGRSSLAIHGLSVCSEATRTNCVRVPRGEGGSKWTLPP